MKKEIIQIGNPVLHEISERVEQGSISSGKIQDLIDNLLDTVNAHSNSAAGLSAVQIGILKQIFVVKRMDLTEPHSDKMEVMINPLIKFSSREISTEWEGCMSINSDGQKLFGPVDRSRVVEVEFLDREGNTKTLKASDFFSHLVQHEVDHLNGKLFISYIDNPKNIWKESELDSYLKQYKKFPPAV